VINVDVTPDTEVHIHRIGRTGRVDEEGWAFSLVSGNEMGRIANIEKAQGSALEWHSLSSLQATAKPLKPPMSTLQILGGRKEKIRPGDVLGALTGEAGYSKEQIGKINVTEFSTYVAVDRRIADEALRKLSAGTVKGKKVKVHLLQEAGKP
jgi:ATP-independent RNA helicase DbpA